MDITKLYRDENGNRYEYRLYLTIDGWSSRNHYKRLSVFVYAPKKRKGNVVMPEDIANLPKEWLEDIENELLKVIRNIPYQK